MLNTGGETETDVDDVDNQSANSYHSCGVSSCGIRTKHLKMISIFLKDFKNGVTSKSQDRVEFCRLNLKAFPRPSLTYRRNGGGRMLSVHQKQRVGQYRIGKTPRRLNISGICWYWETDERDHGNRCEWRLEQTEWKWQMVKNEDLRLCTCRPQRFCWVCWYYTPTQSLVSLHLSDNHIVHNKKKIKR